MRQSHGGSCHEEDFVSKNTSGRFSLATLISPLAARNSVDGGMAARWKPHHHSGYNCTHWTRVTGKHEDTSRTCDAAHQSGVRCKWVKFPEAKLATHCCQHRTIIFLELQIYKKKQKKPQPDVFRVNGDLSVESVKRRVEFIPFPQHANSSLTP